MQPLNKPKPTPLEGTTRIEAFSDGVIAIILTILILEIKVPEIHVLTTRGALEALIPILPKLISFVISFVTIAIIWVNHHHFFHPILKSDSSLLWYNNHLLFWLAVIPFATAFIGDYPTLPLVVAIYGFVLFMATVAFSLMCRHVFFKSELLPPTISLPVRKAEFNHSLAGVLFYGVSVAAAFIHPYISLGIFILVPIYFFIPHRIEEGEEIR